MNRNDYRPKIDGSCFIHPQAIIIGRVELSRDCSVWPYAVMRGDEEAITVGERSNIQDGAVIHTDAGFPTKIGKDVTIGHGAVVHGCTIGNRCIIGIRSIILNGSIIEDGCVIGAGAVVTPGSKIPTESMVMGIPGKIIKTDPSLEKMAMENSSIYVKLAGDHRDGRFATYGTVSLE